MATKKNKRISAEESNLSPSVKKLRGHTKASGTTDEGIQRTRPTDGSSSSDDILCSTSMSTVLSNKFEHSIRCSVCLSVVFPPIKLCVDGHSFCGRCFALLKECPLCKNAQGTGRNYATKSLLDELKLLCRHGFFGCKQILNKLQRVEHETWCVHNIFKCTDSKVEHTLEDFDDCFTSSPIHPCSHITTSTDANGKLKRVCKDELHYMYYEGNVGFFSLCRVEGVGTFYRRMMKRDEVWNLWIGVADCESEPLTMWCKLKLSNLDNTLTLTYSGPIFSVGELEEELLESGECFSIPNIIIKKLLDATNEFSVSLEMIMLSE